MSPSFSCLGSTTGACWPSGSARLPRVGWADAPLCSQTKSLSCRRVGTSRKFVECGPVRQTRGVSTQHGNYSTRRAGQSSKSLTFLGQVWWNSEDRAGGLVNPARRPAWEWQDVFEQKMGRQTKKASVRNADFNRRIMVLIGLAIQ